MKTKEQIIDYINNRPWKNAFYENAFKGGIAPSYDEFTIYNSFIWNDTKEGVKFWGIINKAYTIWFEGEEHAVISWEEYCEKVPITNEDYCYTDCRDLIQCNKIYAKIRHPKMDVNIMSKNLCEAFNAYMKLVQLKAYWDKDYNYSEYSGRYKIALNEKNDIIFEPISVGKSPIVGFYFPTKKYANKFYETFKDLFEIAKPIL